MSEPISAGVAGVAAGKALGLAGMGALGAALASVVVMSSTKPKTEQEWRVALISTVVASVGGGSAVVRYFGLQAWADDPFGLPAIIALVFACGLPGWTVVRAVFRYLDKKKDADIVELVHDVKTEVLK